jgi:D-alanyl-D-alanine carboxypeptidase
MLPISAGAAGRNVSGSFALSFEELKGMTMMLPRDLQASIRSSPEVFLSEVEKVLDEPASLFVLVDKKHALPDGYVPPDLVLLKDYGLTVSLDSHMVRKIIIPDLLRMERAARAEGITLVFSSAYRSYEYQVTVYNREVKLYGQEAADRESARPGTSQHQLGTAMDFGSITDAFAGTRAGRWLGANAGTYGFSLSFPEGFEEVTGYRHESWHFRYVTPAGTELQRKFFGNIQQYMLEFLDANRAALEAKRLH